MADEDVITSLDLAREIDPDVRGDVYFDDSCYLNFGKLNGQLDQSYGQISYQSGIGMTIAATRDGTGNYEDINFRVDGALVLQLSVVGARQARFVDGSSAMPGISFLSDGTFGIFKPDANTFGIATSGTQRVGITNTTFTLTPAFSLGPNASLFVLSAAAANHTGLTSESFDVAWLLDRTVTFVTGSAIGQQRAFYVKAPTYASATGPDIISTAATVAISGAPIAGANMTLTNSYALWIQSGYSRIPFLHTGGVASAVQFTSGGANSLDVYVSATENRIESSGQELQIKTLLNQSIKFYGFNTLRAEMSGVGYWTWTPAAGGTGVYNLWNLNGTGATHTNITAESPDAYINLARTVGASTMATQRAVLITAPTYAGAAPAQTITTAATLAVSGAPTAGANMTITNSYAIYSGGDVYVNGKLTVTGAIDPTYIRLTSGSASNVYIEWTDGRNVPVSSANEGRIRYNTAAQSFQVSENGGAWADLTVGGNAFLQGGNTFGATADLGTNDAYDLAVRAGGNTTLTILGTQSRQVKITPTGLVTNPSYAGTALLIEAPSHSGQIGEVADVIFDFNPGATRNISFAGDVPTQRLMLFAGNVTLVGSGAPRTITTAANVAINGAPVAGPNMTITNSYALWVQSGQSRFDARLDMKDPGTGNMIGLTAGGGGSILDATTTGSLRFSVNSSVFGAFAASYGMFTLSPKASAGPGGATLFWFDASAATHTGLTGEAVDVDFSLSRTVTFAGGGAPATQRAFVIRPVTYASASGNQTVADAATVTITGAPSGTGGPPSLTITYPYALWIQGGESRFDGRIRVEPSGGGSTINLTNAAVVGATFSYSVAGNNVQIGGSTGITTVLLANGSNRANLAATNVGTLTLTPGSASSGAGNKLFVIDASGAAHTGQTGESIDVDWNLNRTVTWTGGSTPATQRAIYFRGPNYAATSASTITTAVNLYVEAPLAGANMTLTNVWSIYTTAGIYVGGNSTINGKLTVTGAIDPTSLTLSGGGTAHYIQFGAGSTAPVSGGSLGRLVYNESAQAFQVSENGVAYDTLVLLAKSQVLTGKTLTTPTIASFVNAGHSHENAAGGGTISILNATTGTLSIARGGTGQTAKTAAFDALSPVTTKGDIIVRDASNNIRLGVSGNNGYVLMEDSTATSGLKWAAAPGSFQGMEYEADMLENPNNADWAVNVLAPAVQCPTCNSMSVRAFDDGTSVANESVGFQRTIPSGATSIKLSFKSKAATGPIAARTVGLKLYTRQFADNVAAGSWSAGTQLTDIDIPATTAYVQYDTQTISLATLGLTAGNLCKFELTRVAPTGGTNLGGDWHLVSLKIEFL